MHQVVAHREAALLDDAGGVDDLLHRRAVSHRGGHRVERRLGGRVQVAVKRRRVRLHREAAQHLPGVIPPHSGQLAEHHVAALHFARRMELRRHEELRLRHRGDADEMDEGGSALAHIGALDQVAELALGHPGLRAVQKTFETGVAEGCADAQPVDLFLRLDGAQADIFGVELDDGERSFQFLLFTGEQRSHQPHSFGAPSLELFDGLLDAAVLPPAHLGVARQLPRQREMVVPLDVHGHLLAGPEDDVGLDGSRPAGDPLRRIADAVVGDHQQMIQIMLLHHRRERLMPPGVFGVREARVLLLDDRPQAWLKPQHFSRAPAFRQSPCAAAPCRACLPASPERR